MFKANNIWSFIAAIDFVYIFTYLGDLSPLKFLWLDTTTRTKMNIFVIGNENIQNGALLPIRHDFYPRIP